jgi:hypothetical protein
MVFGWGILLQSLAVPRNVEAFQFMFTGDPQRSAIGTQNRIPLLLIALASAQPPSRHDTKVPPWYSLKAVMIY